MPSPLLKLYASFDVFNLSNPLSHDLGFLQFLRNNSTINEISSENVRKNKTYYYYPFAAPYAAAELSIKLCMRSCLTCHVFYQIVNSIISHNYNKAALSSVNSMPLSKSEQRRKLSRTVSFSLLINAFSHFQQNMILLTAYHLSSCLSGNIRKSTKVTAKKKEPLNGVFFILTLLEVYRNHHSQSFTIFERCIDKDQPKSFSFKVGLLKEAHSAAASPLF